MLDLSLTQLLWVVVLLLGMILLELRSIHFTLKNPNKTMQRESDREMARIQKEVDREAKEKKLK
jgi:hypothetical protein